MINWYGMIDKAEVVGRTWSFRTITPIVKKFNVKSLQKDVSTYLCSFQSNSYCVLGWLEREPSMNKYHLMIEIFLDDRPRGCIILVGVALEESEFISEVKFVLVRGATKRAITPVIQFLESHGCQISEARCFSPFEVKSLFAGILSKSRHTNGKPLELTYDTKDFVGSIGLDKITLTVPSSAVDQVYILAMRDGDDFDLFDFIGSYFLREFKINIKSFPIMKAANGIVVLDCDGHIKILQEAALENIFSEIEQLISTNGVRS